MSEFYINQQGERYGGDRQTRGIDPETDQPIFDPICPDIPGKPDDEDFHLWQWDVPSQAWVKITKEQYLGPKEAIKVFFRDLLLQMANQGKLSEELSGLINTLRAGIDLTLTEVESRELPVAIALPMIRGSIKSAPLPEALEAVRDHLLQYVEKVLNEKT